MADHFGSIKRLIEVAVTSVTTPSPDGRTGLSGKDFMRDDLTYGADAARY